MAVKDYQFADVEFMTAKDKRLVLSNWITFLKHGCKAEHFTKRLYHHLSQHCSFIAHFSLHGFYSVYFTTNADNTRAFLDQFDPYGSGMSAEYHAVYWRTNPNYKDINEAMRQEARPFLPKLREMFTAQEREHDLAIAQRLAKKHGKQIA